MTNAERVQVLLDRGVVIPAPDQVFVDADVSVDAIAAGSVLHPGTRLEGARTFMAPGAEAGSAGPATVRNCVLGHGAKLGSGLFEGAVLFDGASFGPCCHARDGTLLEEGASVAHASGTKQTVLLPFATLGSNINCCDALLAGGTGPQDHSEIGSGFIHFNFTPHGVAGDKATPSLFGDVPRGVWLREKRIFLGGAGGVVGPAQVGFGTVLAAGSVWRRNKGEGVLALAERLPERELVFNASREGRPREKLKANLRYIGNLCALRAFHQEVRLPLAGQDAARRHVVQAAIALLAASVEERVKQMDRWIQGLNGAGEAEALRRAWPHLAVALRRLECAAVPDALRAALRAAPSHPAAATFGPVIPWLSALPEATLTAGREWLAVSVQWRIALSQYE